MAVNPKDYLRRRNLDAEDRLSLDPLPKMARVTCPVLLLHGEQDAAIAIAEAVTAYDGLRCDKRLIRLEGNPALEHQAAQIAVGGNIVEPVVVNARVRDMGGHVLHGLGATKLVRVRASKEAGFFRIA